MISWVFTSMTSSSSSRTWKNMNHMCRNPSLRLMTRAMFAKVQAKRGSPRITFHALRSVGECEGMNPHTPKWALTLGVGVPVDFRIFKKIFQRSKFIGLKSSLYH